VTKKWEWKWIFDAITALSVLVGITIGVIELKQLGAAQQSQTLLELYQTLHDPTQVRGRELLTHLPDTISPAGLAAVMEGPDGPVILQTMMAFEGIGVMVYRGDISIEWVDELFHYAVVTSWKKIKPGIIARREQTGYPGVLEWHQWLAERLEEHGAAGGNEGAYDRYRDWKPRR
jgi:hypothetical protein